MRLIAILDNDEGYGAILELAETFGWEDTFADGENDRWTPQEADACEQSALDHLAVAGVLVIDNETGARN